MDALAQVRRQFQPGSTGLRWPAPDSWHITLQFLGHATEPQASCLTEKLRDVEAARVAVRIEGLGLFERAGVFWAGVALTPELLALQQKVVAATRRCGFEPEDQAYHPHITLARVRGRSGTGALAPLKKAVERLNTKPGEGLKAQFTAEEFLLYESFPGPEGSRYQVRGRFRLR